MPTTVSNAPQVDADEILEGVRRWVTVESPSHDAAAVNAMVDVVARDMNETGAEIERIPGRDDCGDILIARAPWGQGKPGILVLSHTDTVHSIGVLADKNPWRREGDKVFGPGIYDMKAGAYIAHYAYRHLVREGGTTALPITFLYVPDEEIGSRTSREIIEREAGNNKYVLVTEPARDGGKVVTARKGMVNFIVRATGLPSHAGSRHNEGHSAIREMAHLILEIEAITDYEREITVNVGVVKGGTRPNVVPAECVVEVDMRIPDMESANECIARMQGLQAVNPNVAVEVETDIERTPYVKDEGIRKLFSQARELASEIGFELKDLKTGGCSDGNFTAALGIPTLDGLGADGAGGHTHHEHIYFSSLEPRTKLMIGLFKTLG